MHGGVEIIEEEVFYGCISLRGIKLPGVRVIEQAAFSECTMLVGDITMDGASFDQWEELKQQDDPKEQAAVHEDAISRSEEDETDKSISSAGAGSNLEDDTAAAKEIEGMHVETKDDNSFEGGDQNDDFHMDLEGVSDRKRGGNPILHKVPK
jgi:hypothetical protein